MNSKCEYENVLTLTKSLAMLYINGTIESSNKSVHNLMHNGLNTLLELQDEIYQTMKDDGYYQVCNVKTTEITKTLNKLTKGEN